MDDQFRNKLQTVFDVCDVNKEGHITTEHFKGLAKEHFGASSGDEVIIYLRVFIGDGYQHSMFMFCGLVITIISTAVIHLESTCYCCYGITISFSWLSTLQIIKKQIKSNLINIKNRVPYSPR